MADRSEIDVHIEVATQALQALVRARLAEHPPDHFAAVTAALDQVAAARAWLAFTVAQVYHLAAMWKALYPGAAASADPWVPVVMDADGQVLDIDSIDEVRGSVAAARALAAVAAGDSALPFLLSLSNPDDIEQARKVIDTAWRDAMEQCAALARGTK